MKAADAKKRLVEESVKLIDEQGLGALSFREMARRAGVSHQAPYHHFTNREGILAAIAQEGFALLDEKLVAARTPKSPKPAQAVLKDVLRAYIDFAVENQVHFRVMFRPELVPLRQHPDVRAHAELAFQRLVDSVADCHPAARKEDKKLLEISNALWGAAHGLATLWLDGPMKLNSPELTLGSLASAATDIFSDAGANAKRVSQKRSDRFSAGKTASSRTT